MTLLRFLRNELSSIYDERECSAVSRVIVEDLLGLKMTDVLMGKDLNLTVRDKEVLEKAISRLKKGEPVQHVIGFAWFGNLKFNVTSDTLIPRPETKELVDWIVEENKGKDSFRVLDIGTGSGCIAISLSSCNPEWKIEAWDISERAIEIAIGNAEMNGADVEFRCCDLFQTSVVKEKFDIIVSNPPYITPQEKSDMERHVLDYEPSLALFVPMDDPLLFYREIAEKGLDWINSRGKLYFEINRAYCPEVTDLLTGLGYTDVTPVRDYNGNYRFVRAVR